uniref:Solute carrier family 22 member 5-like n=1 Tax=Gouania willdenowi TaxID=441366 RepID=A0A8C5GGC8_GOUWI
MKEYEETTAFLGQWGPYQKIIFFLICSTALANGLVLFSLVFLNGIPKHHCLIPEVNLTEEWRAAIIPIEVLNGKQELSRCSRYRLDVVLNLSAQGLNPGVDVNLTDLHQENCVDGWNYSKDIYQSTFVSEFNLVCKDQWKQPFTSSINFVGVLFGSFVSGQLSDRFGRKPVLFVTMAVQTIFSFVTIFSPSWTVLCILIFLASSGQIGNYVAGFVLGCEILSGNARVLFSSLGISLGFSIGYMILPLFAFFLRDWKSLQLGLAVPGLLYIPMWWMITESPRWLLSQGRAEEAEAILRNAAKKNKIEAPDVIFGDPKEVNIQAKQQYHIIDLIRTLHVRNTTFLLFLLWVTVATGYVGLSINTAQLHPNPYLSCFLSAVVEVPAYISSWLALQYISRRLSFVCILVVAGSSLYLIQLVPEGLSGVTIALEMLGKFAITAGATLVYAYTAEIYPTGLRNTGTAVCGSVSRMGSILSPFLLSLSVYYKFMPQLVLGTLAFVSLFTTLFMPETFKKPLPQCIEEMPKRKRFIPSKKNMKRQSHIQYNTCNLGSWRTVGRHKSGTPYLDEKGVTTEG